MDHHLLRGRIIHVNEDGWVVINRGAQDGVSEGQRFAVLGERNPRQIRDLFTAAGAGDQPDLPVVLHTDTAYELLRVILVERRCCVAISDRVPPERTPQAFLGPQGELLVYTPPPPDWRYDALDLEEAANNTDEATDKFDETDDEDGEAEEVEAEEAPVADDLAMKQQERLWDGSLPLNALQVGDEVVQAQPYHPGVWAIPAAGETSAAPTETNATPDSDKPPTDHAAYDWLKL
jgi:hypothetical protein